MSQKGRSFPSCEAVVVYIYWHNHCRNLGQSQFTSQDCTYCWWTARFSDTFAYKNLVACFGAHLMFTNNDAHQISIYIYKSECCCESFLNSQKAHVYLILVIIFIYLLVSDTSFYFLNVCHFGSGLYTHPLGIIVSPQNLSCAIATVVDMYSKKANFWNICVL